MNNGISNKNLYSRTDILFFLEELLLNIQGLELDLNLSYMKKISIIKQMKEIINARELPVLNENGDWCYKIQCTMSALYLNMVLKDEKQRMLKEHERAKGFGYNLIKIAGRLLTIEKFAELHNTTQDAVRKQLRIGQLPYAKKYGSAWLIPEFSVPIKEEKLTGWFFITNSNDDFVTNDGLNIILPKHSKVSILPNGRTEDNKKIFILTINSYDPVTEQPKKIEKYNLGLNDKNKFLFHLISNPEISYHSSDIGLANWLFG